MVFEILNISPDHTKMKQKKGTYFALALLRTVPVLVDVVKPVNNVEEGEESGEEHPRPLVDRVYISQVWDGDLELRRASP